jgi:hypothetical protein
MFFGEIYEGYIAVKEGFFKKREVHKKVYSFKITHEGKIGGLQDSMIGVGGSPYIPGLYDYINRVHSFDTLEKAIEMKQRMLLSMFINYDLTDKNDIPPYNIERGKFEKDVNYNKEYLKEKFYQYRYNKQGKKCY